MKKLAKLGLLGLAALTLVACSQQSATTNVGSSTTASSTVQTSSSSAISQDQAKEKALALVGVSEGDVTNLTVKQDSENGQTVYEVDFDYAGKEYSYTINAQTGEVVEQEQEQADSQAATALSADDAKVIAFKDFEQNFGGTESDVTNLTVKQDTDNGTVVYDIDFDYNGYEYSYEINAETGAIVGFDQDLID